MKRGDGEGAGEIHWDWRSNDVLPVKKKKTHSEYMLCRLNPKQFLSLGFISGAAEVGVDILEVVCVEERGFGRTSKTVKFKKIS